MRCAELNGEQRNEVMEVLRTYEEIFTKIPGKASVIEHKIDLTDDRPIRCKPYPLPISKRGEIREEIKNMMDTGIVRKSSSSYASSLVVVKKKDGSNRMCVDYRKLNLVTVADLAPMTTAEDLFGKLGKCQYYSTIGLSKGYWQILVAEEDIHKSAFVTPDDCYEFLRTSFGMKNYGAMLVRNMRKLLQDMDNVECCIDDLIVYTKDWATHLQVLDKLLENLFDLPSAYLARNLKKKLSARCRIALLLLMQCVLTHSFLRSILPETFMEYAACTLTQVTKLSFRFNASGVHM